MTEKIVLFILILLASWVNNWFLPFILYHFEYGLFQKKYKGRGGCNGWGIIGDGILAGLINITILYFLFSINPLTQNKDLVLALILGFFSMVVTHIWMSICRWETWIMPKPWHWNSGGYWHMFSMTMQIAFLWYPLILIFRYPILLRRPVVIMNLGLCSLWIGIFLASFYWGMRGLKIGRFHLNSESW